MASVLFKILSLLWFSLLANAYTNPILKSGGADPFVFSANGGYYLLYTTGSNVQVTFSKDLTNFDDGERATVWASDGVHKNVWAPEMHYINGRYYVYVAMDDGENKNHRMFVLEGDTEDPLAPATMVGKLSTPDDNWAIDGTVLKDYNGKDYFIWSGWENSGDSTQHLYIAQMDGPTKLAGERVRIGSPDQPWEQHGAAINEGPEILVHDGRVFLIYSASGYWVEDYCLGMMGIDNNQDPLVAGNWWKYTKRAVLWKSENAVGPGHASFVFDSEGTPWVVYHAYEDIDSGRRARVEQFKWNADSSPWFPVPAALGVELSPAPAAGIA